MSGKDEAKDKAPDETGAAVSESPAAVEAAAPKPVSAAAARALKEAEERRAAYEAQVAAMPRELGGRGGKEPGRYGDWEVKGIATDF